jgi:hypothetical protein
MHSTTIINAAQQLSAWAPTAAVRQSIVYNCAEAAAAAHWNKVRQSGQTAKKSVDRNQPKSVLKLLQHIY